MTDLSEKDFNNFRKLIYERSGICLKENKKLLVRSRLAKRLKQLGISCYKEYYDIILADKTNKELINLLDVISTNVTSFYRENQHFIFLKNKLLPELIKKNDSYIHIWSSACSTGEEPYSIAMTVIDTLKDYNRYNIKILATDISQTALQASHEGQWIKEKVKGVPPEYLNKYFTKSNEGLRQFYNIKPELKKIIKFRMLNLNQPSWSFKKLFDVIFCRNVMIYFDRETQEKLINKFYTVLKPGGYLLVGHSESLTGIKHKFDYVQATIYRK